MGGGVVFQLGGASFLKGVRHGASILMGGGGKKKSGCPPCHARPLTTMRNREVGIQSSKLN